MPNLDGTGPMGQGAMSGRRRGRCRESQTIQKNTENQSAIKDNIVYGRGRGGRPRGGGGFGQGQCRRKGFGRNQTF